MLLGTVEDAKARGSDHGWVRAFRDGQGVGPLSKSTADKESGGDRRRRLTVKPQKISP